MAENHEPSSNRDRVGVLFVHGVGQAAHSDTLIDFGQAFAGWVARWQQAKNQQPSYREAELSFTPYDAGSDNAISNAELAVSDRTTWVFAEAWWASSARPMPLTRMFTWSVQHLVGLIVHLVQSIIRRFDRLGNPSRYDAGWLSRVVDVVNCVLLIVVYPVVGVLGYVVLIPVMILAQIPYPPLQQFVLVTLFQPFLQYNASELRVFIEDEIQAANMRRRVADAVDWLTDKRFGNCHSVRIVAHSGGAWVAHGMLTDTTYARQSERVRKFITLGSGLNKIWELAPKTLERVRKPVTGNIFWVDFWASYDPVPAGWLEPPKKDVGWYPIYAPDSEFAIAHGLKRRSNPMPPDQARGWTSDATPTQEDRSDPYWPESIRVVNCMDALTDHGGYFSNDEEVLRRVAAEIDSELYRTSCFWTGPNGRIGDAIPRRRSRVAVLGSARIVGVVIGVVAALFLAGTVAEYIQGIGPIAAALSGAREVGRLLEKLRPVGQVWAGLTAALLWLAGAAIAALVFGLAPFEVFRARWEYNDLRAREALLRERNDLDDPVAA